MRAVETTGGTVRVVLVAGHALVRKGLRTALDRDPSIEVLHETASLPEAAEVASAADVVVVDSSSCDVDAPLHLARIRTLRPRPAVIVLAAGPGAAGQLPSGTVTRTLPRTVEPAALVAALRRIVLGLPEPASRRAGRPGERELTDRESQILDGLARGLTNGAIARELWLSEHTVKFHVSAIYRKLRVRSRGEAARWVRENGFGLRSP